ncbi:hypothetical protein ES703_77179 [subsurface metagenome]
MQEGEYKIFGNLDISRIFSLAGSDRRFFDNFLAVWLDSYTARPNKGTDSEGITPQSRRGLALDWGSGQFLQFFLNY